VEREMTGFERATLQWAKVAVGMSAVAAFFVCLQWWEMHTGGADTHALAMAAKTQTENSMAQFRDEQRAWVGVSTSTLVQFEPANVKIQIVLINTGRTPARMPHISTGFVLAKTYLKEPPADLIAEIEKLLPDKPATALPPGGLLAVNMGGNVLGLPLREQGNAEILRESYEPIKDKTLILYFFGEIDYLDVSDRRHASKFCVLVNNPETKEIQACDGFNEIN
jgi:hypothetical protein